MKGTLHAMLYKLFTFIPAQATFCILCCSILLRWSHPLPDQLPMGAYRPPISYEAVPLYCLAFQCSIHSHTYSWQIEVWWSGMFQWTTHVLLCAQSHRHDSTQPSLFTSWVALCEPLVCSYDISHSRAWQASITSLAASSVA